MKAYTLIGVNGNAFAIMAYTASAMKAAKFSKDEIDQMHTEAKSGDYWHLIAVCDSYIDAVNERLGWVECDDYEDTEE